MQVKKENIRERILEAAREEFQKKNYQKASMRQIAKKAEVTTSNIYNYFENKDDIFTTILQPLIDKIEIGKRKLAEFEFNRKEAHSENLEDHLILVEESAKFVNQNREGLKLLIFNAEGSALENYTDELISWFTENFKKSINGKHHQKIDSFFYRITTSIWINTIREVLLKDIKGKRLIQNAKDLMTFIFHGWKGLVEEKEINIDF